MVVRFCAFVNLSTKFLEGRGGGCPFGTKEHKGAFTNPTGLGRWGAS
jgi:hypothetical protein